jgi:ABC-2 type transport system ATP-binding protein
VLKGISVDVNPGQVIALLGKNGAGKTTLLECLLGFGFPSFGDAKLWGVKATDIEGDIKQRIGFVPQQDELLPSLTGNQHLDLFKAFRPTWNESLVNRLVAEWLIPLDINTGKMSVGQRQKLSILLAMAHEPELLILDEPVASLDPIARRQFLQQLVDIAADERRAVIFSTHIVSDVERVANHVWMMIDGNFAYQGDLDSLKESVARVTFAGVKELPAGAYIPGLVRKKVQGNQLVLTLSQWSATLQQQLEQQISEQISIEYLCLEDIFLEMNL